MSLKFMQIVDLPEVPRFPSEATTPLAKLLSMPLTSPSFLIFQPPRIHMSVSSDVPSEQPRNETYIINLPHVSPSAMFFVWPLKLALGRPSPACNPMEMSQEETKQPFFDSGTTYRHSRTPSVTRLLSSLYFIQHTDRQYHSASLSHLSCIQQKTSAQLSSFSVPLSITEISAKLFKTNITIGLPDLNLYFKAVSDAFWELWGGNPNSYANLNLVLQTFAKRLDRHERMHRYEIELHAIMGLLVMLASILLIYDDAVCLVRFLCDWAVKKWSKDKVQQADRKKLEREAKG
jgi:hypothetical protein